MPTKSCVGIRFSSTTSATTTGDAPPRDAYGLRRSKKQPGGDRHRVSSSEECKALGAGEWNLAYSSGDFLGGPLLVGFVGFKIGLHPVEQLF